MLKQSWRTRGARLWVLVAATALVTLLIAQTSPSEAGAQRPEPGADLKRRQVTATEMNRHLERDVSASELVTITSPTDPTVSAVVTKDDLARGIVGFDRDGNFQEQSGSGGAGETDLAVQSAPEAGLEAPLASAAAYRQMVAEGCVNLTQGKEKMLRCYKKWQVKNDGSDTRNYYLLEMTGALQGPNHSSAGLKVANRSTPGIAWAYPAFAPAQDSSGNCSSPSFSSISAFGLTFGTETTRCEVWDMNFSTLPGTYRLVWADLTWPIGTNQNRNLSLTVHVSVPQNLTGAPGPIWDFTYMINCSHPGWC